MRPRNTLLLFTLASALACTTAHAAALRVVTTHEGKTLELAGKGPRETFLAGPDRVPVPPGGAWQLEGDLFAAGAPVRWSPAYFLRRAEERVARGTPDKPWRAKVEISHVPKATGDAPKGVAPIQANWPAGLPAGGVAVVAWVAGDRVIDVVLLALPPAAEESFGFAAEFVLTQQEASTGQPAVLLWHEGAFLAPAPLFADATTDKALLAIVRDDAAALAPLLGAGAQTEARSRDGYSLIHYAAEAGADACTELLLQHKAALATQDDAHDTKAIHHAAALGRVEVVRSLLKARRKLAESEAPGSTFPLTLATEGGHAAVVDLLLAAGARPTDENHRRPPLALALENGYADIAEQLVSAKATFKADSPQARGALLLGAARGNNTLVRWLLQRGVDAKADFRGTTALDLAARGGDAEAARALLEAGAAVDSATAEGFTPLMSAARVGNIEYARVLLEAGADPKRSTQTGVTPLHFAAQADASELVVLLLERGADPHARTSSGLTPLELALAASGGSTARTLASRGASIDLGQASAESLLVSAIRLDVAEVIDEALKAGWPADSTFAGVWRAARVAEIFRSERCLQALLAAGAAAPDASLPMPVAAIRELDQPVKVARRAVIEDPRDSDEVYLESTVRVSVLVDAEGRPLFPALSHVPDPRLGIAALKAIEGFRFEPMRRQGQPVAVRVQVPLSFPASSHRTYELARLQKIPVPIKQSPPSYPPALKKQGITGRAVVGFVVDTTGRVRDVVVLDATHPAFGQAVVEAVSTWVFKPGILDGEPVNTQMKQPMVFTLQD